MFDYILIGTPGPTELIVILLLVLVLFGAKKIPEIAQGLGKGIREFKKSMKEVQGEIESIDHEQVKDQKTEKENKKDDKSGSKG
jgi:sec-independent protein translocase protein TatA